MIYDTIYDVIYGMINDTWYDMIYDTIYDMIRYDIYMIYDVIYGMIHDMIYDMILIYLLTAIWLPPGGSSTVHIYTQIHRTQRNRIYRTEHT
jgi:hypothetical protein